MEDLISFEDLVVQPCNSYFNLEKELHEVKSKLSLMEQRLKYLEEKIGYGCKGQLNLEEKIEALDIKYEELDDEIVSLEDSVQKDIKSINYKLTFSEEDAKTIKGIYVGGMEIIVDYKTFDYCSRESLKNLISYVSNYNIIKVLSIKLNSVYSKDKFEYLFTNNRVKIEKLIMNMGDFNFRHFIDTIIIKNKFNCGIIELYLPSCLRKNEYYLTQKFKNELDILQRYCDCNKIELKVC